MDSGRDLDAIKRVVPWAWRCAFEEIYTGIKTAEWGVFRGSVGYFGIIGGPSIETCAHTNSDIKNVLIYVI